MPRVLTRSPIKMPGIRQCRLARRLAAGLSPAEIKRLDTATEEDIEAFVSDRDLSRLVDQYAALRALPLPERQARLFETAWLELSSLIDVGDRRAMLFVVYQANRARHPVRHLVKLVVERFENVRQPYERHDTPSPAGSSPETMQGYGQHPLGPAQEAINRLVDFLPAQAGEAVLVRAETDAPVGEPVATTEEIPVGDVGDPASADDERLSPLAAMARANPALAEWIIGRIEKRLAELGAEEPEPDDPRRLAGRKPLGP